MTQKGFALLTNDFADTERAVLADIHGIDKADAIIADANGTEDAFDTEIQEIIDEVLPLDEL